MPGLLIALNDISISIVIETLSVQQGFFDISALLTFFAPERGRLESLCAFYNVWQDPWPLPSSCQ